MATMDVFQNTAVLAIAEGSTFSLINAAAAWSNSQTQMLTYAPGGFQVLQNGEIVLIGASVVSYVLGFYMLKERNNELAAFGITEGSFFLVSAIVAIVERFAVSRKFAPSQLTQVARAKRLPPNPGYGNPSTSRVKLSNAIKLAN